MLSGHSDLKSLTLRYRWALCRGRVFVTPHERFVREAGEVCRGGPVRARDDARTAAGGHRQAKVQEKYKGRKPTARAKAQDAIRLFKEGKKVAHIASELGIGRGSVYRALESTGQARKSLSRVDGAVMGSAPKRA
jgi:hypothetical protein